MMSSQTPQLPQTLLRGLNERFGLTRGSLIASAASVQLTGLLNQSSPFVDARERAFVAERVLPLLAVYRALQASGMAQQAAETELRRLAAWALRETPVRGAWLAARLPGRRHWLRRIVRREATAAFPDPMFTRIPVQRGDADVTLEVRRCLYAAAVVAYRAPELLPMFCRLDEIRFERMANVVTCAHHTPTADSPQCQFCFTLRRDTGGVEAALEGV
jgi:hypothetical protein